MTLARMGCSNCGFELTPMSDNIESGLCKSCFIRKELKEKRESTHEYKLSRRLYLMNEDVRVCFDRVTRQCHHILNQVATTINHLKDAEDRYDIEPPEPAMYIKVRWEAGKNRLLTDNGKFAIGGQPLKNSTKGTILSDLGVITGILIPLEENEDGAN